LKAEGVFAEARIESFLDHISSPNFDRESVGKSTKLKEWDAAGWYCPITFFGFQWGIYLRISSIYDIALDILNVYSSEYVAKLLRRCTERTPYYDNLQDVSDTYREGLKKASIVAAAVYGQPYSAWTDVEDQHLIRAAIRMAYLVLFSHEKFHHMVEALGIGMTVVSRRPIYVSYSDSVYKASKGTSKLIEEALANAYSIRCVLQSESSVSGSSYARVVSRMSEACVSYLQARFPADPPGYNRALEFLKDDEFARGLSLLIGQLRQSSAAPLLHSAIEAVLAAQCNCLLEDGWVRTVEIREPSNYRILPDASPFDNRGKRLQKFLQRHGFALVRQGEHEVWQKSGVGSIPVPRTTTITDPVAESIIKRVDSTYRIRNFASL